MAKHIVTSGSGNMRGTAVPISSDWKDNPHWSTLAEPLLNPENLDILYPAGKLMHAVDLAKMARKFGIDYVTIV